MMIEGAAAGRLDAMSQRIADHPVAQLERAFRHLRLNAANDQLDAALAARAPAAFLREVGDPLVRRLRDDDAATRLATAMIEQRVLVHTRSWTAIPGPLVALACAPWEGATVSLLALGFALAERRCRIAYLGSYTPAHVLCAFAGESRCAVVVLAAAREQLAPADRRELAAITRPLVVVGRARERVARMLGVPALAPGTAAVDIARTARTSSVVEHDRVHATAVTR
jgi:hypothetical protein